MLKEDDVATGSITPPAAPLRVGIVGSGSMGRVHARGAWVELAHVESENR